MSQEWHRRLLTAGILAALLGLGPAPSLAAEDGDPASRARAEESPGAYHNRLRDSRSPYLLLHADNPVDWYPWGEEAFAKARREDKPIFLSIGYSTCYWCHVAERTLYSDPAIAALMNRWYVNVKVDSEQRPDLDRIYMLARELLTGRGGWPNNLFLTPDLKPFFAVGYAPPEADARGRTPFPVILEMIAKVWVGDREKVMNVAETVLRVMHQVEREMAGGDTAPVDPADWLARASAALMERFDFEHGGFIAERNRTKFPMTPVLGMLLARSRNGDREALEALTRTLDAMAYGGVYDHLAGGFHRYSTEPTWSVPHFEKMLYDNAQLLELYARAYRATARPLYGRIAGELAGYLSGQMMAPDGEFYTAEDSQVNGEEGASYAWTRAEVVAILGEAESRRFFEVYELTPMPIMLPGGLVLAPGSLAGDDPSRDDLAGVLRVRLPIADTLGRAGFRRDVTMLTSLAPMRQRLLRERRKRPQAARDEKINVGLNGLAISAFVESGRIFDSARNIDLAARAADSIWRHAYDEATNGLKHEIFRGRAQTDGYLADYALFGRALMSLFEATDKTVWRDRAENLAQAILDRFKRADGGLRMAESETNLLIPPEDTGDSVHPSGTSATIDLLLRLGEATGADRYADAAGRLLSHYSGRIARQPDLWATVVLAANAHGAALAAKLGPAQATNSAETYRVPTTADHVRATATIRAGEDHDRISVTLEIDKGFHINANPASLEGLIPTSLAFDGYIASRIAYPTPSRFQPCFVPEGLDVYEGKVELVALFPKGTFTEAGPVQGAVTAQACNDITCLAPTDLPIMAVWPAGPQTVN